MKFTNKPFLITGINHSGTTMLVEVLKRMGIYMGEKGVIEESNNEWNIFLNANMRILWKYNSHLSSSKPWIATKYPPIKQIEKDWQEIPLVERDEPWGIKMPSICILLPAYYKRYPNAKIIYITRNRQDLLESLIKRDRGDVKYWNKFINVMDRRFRRVAKDYLELSYEDYCYYPENKTKEMCDYLGISYKKVEGIREYIKKDRINKQ